MSEGAKGDAKAYRHLKHERRCAGGKKRGEDTLVYAFLAVFWIATVIHLYASKVQNSKGRNLSKPFILAALLGFYIFGSGRLSVAVILALFFSWLGDVLLIPKGVKWFTAGGISFMISHAFFIAGYCRDVEFSGIPVRVIVLLGLFFAAVVTFIFSKLRPFLPKALFYPMFFYLLVNGAMNCFALFRCISIPEKAACITAAGAALFFVSDATLFFVRFHKEGRLKTHFLVMLTYSVGEFLIVLGLL